MWGVWLVCEFLVEDVFGGILGGGGCGLLFYLGYICISNVNIKSIKY